MRLIFFLFLLIDVVYCATKLERNDRKLTATSRVCVQGTLLKGDNNDDPVVMLLGTDELCAVKWHVSKSNELVKVESTALPKDKLNNFNKRKCGWIGEENDNFVFITTSSLTGSNSRMWNKAARHPECFDNDNGSDAGPTGWKEALEAFLYEGYETATKIDAAISISKYSDIMHSVQKMTHTWDPFDLPLSKAEGICVNGQLYPLNSESDKKEFNIVKHPLSVEKCFVEWSISIDAKNKRVVTTTANGILKLAHALNELGTEQNCTGFYVLRDNDDFTISTLSKNVNDWKIAATKQNCFLPETLDDDKEIQNLWLNAIAAAKDAKLEGDEDFNWVMKLAKVQAREETLTARKRPPVPPTTTPDENSAGKDGKKENEFEGEEGLGNTWWIVLIATTVVVVVTFVVTLTVILLRRRCYMKENQEEFQKSAMKDAKN